MDFLPGDYGISFLLKILLLMGFEPSFASEVIYHILQLQGGFQSHILLASIGEFKRRHHTTSYLLDQGQVQTRQGPPNGRALPARARSGLRCYI